MKKRLFGSIIIACTATFFGWAALHLVPQKQEWRWVIYPGGLLAMPGVLFSVAVATIFSPQGFHGSDDFSWIVAPVNLLFYFLLFFLIFRRRVGAL
jgi:hypothetical protein